MSVKNDEISAADDGQWLAMQYVLGELPEAQAARYEMAMADDVALCEAVSEAVKLCSGLVLAYDSKHPAGDQVSLAALVPKRSRFAVLPACAAVVLALIVILTAQRSGRSINNPLNTVAEADVLASLVSDESLAETALDSDDDLISEDSMSELIAPEWLLTAIELDEALHRSGVFPGHSADDETDVF